MNIQKEREEHQKALCILECYESLENAINKAGGATDLSKLLKMTVDDFIKEIAGPNHIFFAAKVNIR